MHRNGPRRIAIYVSTGNDPLSPWPPDVADLSCWNVESRLASFHLASPMIRSDIWYAIEQVPDLDWFWSREDIWPHDIRADTQESGSRTCDTLGHETARFDGV